jgi:hypothetical protein
MLPMVERAGAGYWFTALGQFEVYAAVNELLRAVSRAGVTFDPEVRTRAVETLLRPPDAATLEFLQRPA